VAADALPQPFAAYLEHLRSAGRMETARAVAATLRQFAGWLAGRDPLRLTTEDLRAFQRWLADEYRSARDGQRLGRGTQATRLATVKALYVWMYRRCLLVSDIAKPIQLPSLPPRQVQADHLTLQESVALLQTQAARAAAFAPGSARWAVEIRDLAVLALGLATGRRRSGIRDLHVADVNRERSELRVSREKGVGGRVLPVAAWAVTIIGTYIDQARPVLSWQIGNDYLFPGDDGPQLGRNTIAAIIERAHAATVAACPHLTDLAGKRLTPHSLRVSFAHLLFQGGADIRTVNDCMLHRQLGTTARYTPVDLTDLRRVCATAHPRA
jgi:site-specific recombinase XerD